MKKCARKDCEQKNPQPESAFAKDSKNKNGLGSYCKTCTSRLQKEYKIKNPDKAALRSRKGFLKYFYGMTIEQYEQLLEAQGNKCAICRVHALAFEKSLHVDHCHKTGKIRGLLCNNCNFLIGKAHDEIRILNAAIRYLKRQTCLKTPKEKFTTGCTSTPG